MRLSVSLVLSVALALSVAATAQARPKVALRTVADPTIENGVAVFRRAGSEPRDYWCNAGDYASRTLGAGTGAALELVRPEGAPGGPSDRPSIGFRVVAGDGTSGSVTVSEVGERHTLAQTRAFCLSQEDPGR
jgi:hypothetical protein